ncbi:PALB protein [Zalerion maritima]|uniref:PALB protein n=1 Tax=Zalerion maritima TaxID=339359 RepID=A0AAD5RJW4_9PEZI|nr:PALB protein [Zalerion maritima]
MSEELATRYESVAREKEVDDLGLARENAVMACETWAELMRNTQRASEKARYRAGFRRLVPLAERLTFEHKLLERVSTLHGSYFGLSPRPLPPHSFAHVLGQDLFEDTTIFTVSEDQAALLDGWKRPRDLFPGADETQLMVPIHGTDLVQDVTTDCSVVASLCAIMKASEKRKKSILADMMSPYDYEADRPRLSENGKYVFRMHFNGCCREVIVDDRLPATCNDKRSIMVTDRRNPRLIWPALVEKAYLKVRGGYDFPGSNSGVDLSILTGWIPEQVYLHSEDLDFDQLWRRIKLLFGEGQVMVTLGTGVLSREEEEIAGLGGEHDYVVLDVDTAGGERRFLVKNPWAPATVWKGLGGASASFASLSSPSPGTDAKHLDPGTFWINLQEIAQNFLYMYLNFSPDVLFKAQNRHFEWVLDHTSHATHAHNPQFCVSTTRTSKVWVLLRKHFADGELEIARNRSNTSSLTETSQRLGFISLRVFLAGGKRVEVDENPIHKSPWLDSSHTLARFEAKPSEKYTVVVLQDLLPLPRYTFTVSFYSGQELAIENPPDRMAVTKRLKGSWTPNTAGGNSHSASYFQNPQYTISLSSATPLIVVLECSDLEICVHVDIAWNAGKRAIVLNTRDLVGNSGDYRPGAAMADLPLVEAGKYTIVCSTYDPGQLADFTLKVGAMVEFEMEPIPPEHAGRRVFKTRDLVFHAGERKKRAPVRISRLTKAFVLAAHLGPPSQSGLRVSLMLGQGPDARQLAASSDGEFAWAASGIRTPDIDLDPAAHHPYGVWLYVEVMGEQAAPQHLIVQVLSEMELRVGDWEHVND